MVEQVDRVEEPARKVDPVSFHNLFSREIRPPRDWAEWLECWQAARTTCEMLGLLHGGFDVEFEWYYGMKYDPLHRLEFYFEIADGWNDANLLRLRGDRDQEYRIRRDENGNVLFKTAGEIRQTIARKAFDMLCGNFFNPKNFRERGDHDKLEEDQMRNIVSGRLFLVVQKFFRVEKDCVLFDRISVRNLSRHPDGRSNNEKQAVGFLLRMMKYLWTWQEVKAESFDSEKEKARIREHNATMQAAICAARPWMIEVLHYLGELRLLKRAWVLALDEPCLAKLKEIALRSELQYYRHHVTKARKALTLNEACYVGSEAAWILKQHELMSREDRRLREIQKETWAREESDRKIASLIAKT